MNLSKIDSRNFDYDVVIVQTPSTKLDIFIEDKIKREYGATNDSMIEIQSKKDYKKVKDFIGIVPPFSKRWFIKVNIDKINDKDLIKLIKVSNTCVFYCTCSKYAIFKSFKENLGKNVSVADFYINYLRRPDFIYLYDAFVPKDNRLDKQLFDYTVQSYSGDIEALFTLFLALANGEKFKTRKAISDKCGIGGLSVESFIFTLLKEISGSDKGLKTVIKNRVRASTELAQSLGYQTFYNFTNKSITNLIQLKLLMLNGDVYKTVVNLPETYDEKALARYQKYIWRLREMPLSSLVLLKQSMGSKAWRSELDLFEFIYNYYGYLAVNHLNGKVGI